MTLKRHPAAINVQGWRWRTPATPPRVPSPSRLDVHAPVPAPEGVLVPAALGLALAAGLGVAAFLEDLRTFHFGWRQFAAVAAAVGIALPVIGFAAVSPT